MRSQKGICDKWEGPPGSSPVDQAKLLRLRVVDGKMRLMPGRFLAVKQRYGSGGREEKVSMELGLRGRRERPS